MGNGDRLPSDRFRGRLARTIASVGLYSYAIYLWHMSFPLPIARALDDSHGEISLLVLDEPTAALPPAECETLFAVLGEVVAAGVSILTSTYGRRPRDAASGWR